MVVYVSSDGCWRLEQTAKEIRVLIGSKVKGWALAKTARSVAELDRWLKDQGDPVTEWVRD